MGHKQYFAYLFLVKLRCRNVRAPQLFLYSLEFIL